MNFLKPFFLLIAILSVSFNTLAEKIYKTVDESGAVVFSDKKTAGAEKIKVQPNVVDIRTPVMPEPTAKEKQEKAAKQIEVNQTVVGGGGGGTTAGNLKRKIRNVTNAGENIKRPKKQPPTAGQLPATRPGGGRAGGGR